MVLAAMQNTGRWLPALSCLGQLCSTVLARYAHLATWNIAEACRCLTPNVCESVCGCVCELLAAVLLQEAAVLEDCVYFLVSRCRMAPGQLGVITPYAAQVSLLCKRLQQRGYNINGSGGSGSWGDPQDGEVLLLPLLLCAQMSRVSNSFTR